MEYRIALTYGASSSAKRNGQMRLTGGWFLGSAPPEMILWLLSVHTESNRTADKSKSRPTGGIWICFSSGKNIAKTFLYITERETEQSVRSFLCTFLYRKKGTQRTVLGGEGNPGSLSPTKSNLLLPSWWARAVLYATEVIFAQKGDGNCTELKFVPVG